MASGSSNFDRLHEAGIIQGHLFSDSDKKVIEQITAEEVDVLVNLRKKMGEAPEGQAHLRPNIAV